MNNAESDHNLQNVSLFSWQHVDFSRSKPNEWKACLWDESKFVCSNIWYTSIPRHSLHIVKGVIHKLSEVLALPKALLPTKCFVDFVRYALKHSFHYPSIDVNFYSQRLKLVDDNFDILERDALAWACSRCRAWRKGTSSTYRDSRCHWRVVSNILTLEQCRRRCNWYEHSLLHLREWIWLEWCGHVVRILMPATCFLSTRFMRRILSVDDNSNDSLVIFLLMTWSTSHNPEQCSIQQHQVKAQPAFVPQLICPANFPWELLSLNDNLGKFIIDGCPGVGVCLVKHSVTPRNSFAAVRAYSKGEVVSFIDPRLPSTLDTRHPCRDLVLLSERKKCSFCKSSSTCPIQSMLFAGKGCAQLLLCSPGQGVNTELLSVGPFSIYLNGSTTTHSLVVARTTEYVSAGNIFVMNCAYQLEDDTKALSTLDLKTLLLRSP